MPEYDRNVIECLLHDNFLPGAAGNFFNGFHVFCTKENCPFSGAAGENFYDFRDFCSKENCPFPGAAGDFLTIFIQKVHFPSLATLDFASPIFPLLANYPTNSIIQRYLGRFANTKNGKMYHSTRATSKLKVTARMYGKKGKCLCQN